MGVMKNLKIEGLDKLKSSLELLEKRVDGAREATLMAQAKRIKNRIIEKAPRGPTGNLKRSPVVKRMPQARNYPAIVIVAIDRKIAPHAHFVEFGTSRMAAHPFFRPVVEGEMSAVKAAIEKDLKDAVENF
uniref:Putative tail protein n=1 Tax=viral metagenome TaxID=1070528 RepID=A0A6H1ZKA6_9ZZZZ